MSYVHQTLEYKGHTINIVADEDPPNPRTECDEVGAMACWHRRHCLGDEAPLGRPTWRGCFSDPRAWLCAVLEAEGEDEEKLSELRVGELEALLSQYFLWLPLYLYDHSGLTISTNPFSCRWDSGRLGLILVSLGTVVEEFGGTVENLDVPYAPIPDRTVREHAIEYLRGEVKTYDDFLRGNVRTYEIEDANGIVVDSCAGYYPDENDDFSYVLTEAKCVVDSMENALKKIEVALEKAKSTAGAGI